jgi:hypothetical protein
MASFSPNERAAYPVAPPQILIIVSLFVSNDCTSRDLEESLYPGACQIPYNLILSKVKKIVVVKS